MSISNSIKTLIRLASIASFFGLTNVIISNSAQAFTVNFSNGDFENPINFGNGFGDGWDGTGNTTLEGTYSSVVPFPVDISNTMQAVITTACPSSIQTGECLDNDNNSSPRNDDFPTPAGTYNDSGNDQISASVETPNLQNTLGLSDNAFSIYRQINGVTYDGTSGNPVLRRTPKEGSAIYQDIEVVDDGMGVEIKFNWDFLTNDGAGDLGDKDFGFVSITNSSGYEQLIVLEDSTGALPPISSPDFATNTAPYAAYTSAPLSLDPGTYRVGFGVVDVDGVNYSSALLIDNFAVQQVPFEFSPTAGIALVLGLFGCDQLRRTLKIKNQKLRINQV